MTLHRIARTNLILGQTTDLDKTLHRLSQTILILLIGMLSGTQLHLMLSNEISIHHQTVKFPPLNKSIWIKKNGKIMSPFLDSVMIANKIVISWKSLPISKILWKSNQSKSLKTIPNTDNIHLAKLILEFKILIK